MRADRFLIYRMLSSVMGLCGDARRMWMYAGCGEGVCMTGFVMGCEVVVSMWVGCMGRAEFSRVVGYVWVLWVLCLVGGMRCVVGCCMLSFFGG